MTGEWVANIIKHLFPVLKLDSKGLITISK